uniref:Uncharacterized protein n=1 Tax=Populus trichocarpa TaxID=3694 RepID=B9HMP0_POPTR
MGLHFSYTLNPSVFRFNSTPDPIEVGFSVTLNPRGIEFSYTTNPDVFGFSLYTELSTPNPIGVGLNITPNLIEVGFSCTLSLSVFGFTKGFLHSSHWPLASRDGVPKESIAKSSGRVSAAPLAPTNKSVASKVSAKRWGGIPANLGVEAVQEEVSKPKSLSPTHQN